MIKIEENTVETRSRVISANKKITKYTVFVAFITVFKIALMAVCSSDYQNKLFLPFVSDFLTNGGNVYQRFFENGIFNAFPYPVGMLIIQSVGGIIINALKIENLFWNNFLFKLPSFLIDIIGLTFLSNLYKEKRRYIAVFYFASPIVIYGVYMHGQLDLIPTMLMFFAINILVSKRSGRYVWGTVLTVLALLCKLHILSVFPVVLIYICKRDGIKRGIRYGLTVIAGTLIGMAPFMSEGFVKCVLLNSEQKVLTQVYFQFASVQLYIPIAMVFVIYLLAYKLMFMNAELFMNICSIVFAVFLAFCPPMPGWYIWIVPYLAMFFIKIDQEKYKNILVYAMLNILYLIYFIAFHSREYIDLYVGNVDMSFIKIHNQTLVNLAFTLMTGVLLYFVFSMYQLGIASNSLYKRKNMPFTIGIAGDSGTGKSTMIALVQKCLGKNNLLFIEGDGDHRWERGDGCWNDYTALNPKANYLYRQSEDFEHIRRGSAVARVDYDHDTGKFTRKKRITIKKYVILCGLHSMYLPKTRKNLDIKIYMDTDETLRRFWKIGRDTGRRGYTKEAVVKQIEKRIPDAIRYIYPQKQYADFIVKYYDKNLANCMVDNHEVKLNVQLIISASVNAEPLIDEIKSIGIDVNYDYSEDCRSLLVDITSDNLEQIPVPVEKIANKVIPQLDEITREDLDTVTNGTDGVVILFLLLLISNKMQGDANDKMGCF